MTTFCIARDSVTAECRAVNFLTYSSPPGGGRGRAAFFKKPQSRREPHLSSVRFETMTVPHSGQVPLILLVRSYAHTGQWPGRTWRYCLSVRIAPDAPEISARYANGIRTSDARIPGACA